MPQGICATHCQLTGTTEGIMPCVGSVTKPGGNSINQGTAGLVSPYLGKPPRKMPSPTGIGVAKWKKPWREDMMVSRSKRQCFHP